MGLHGITWDCMGKFADYKRNFGDDMGNDIVEFDDLIRGNSDLVCDFTTGIYR